MREKVQNERNNDYLCEDMIGIFDSGVGGLSVFRELKKILPEERYVYYSDNAHCPYGEKSKEYIIDRAHNITDFLLEQGSDIIVIACNTATAAAIKSLRADYPIPFIGMEPAIKPAAAITRTGIIGVLATAGTLKAEKYHDIRGKYADDVQVVEHVGKGFVELVENGQTTGRKADAIVMESLEPLLDAGADTIVLGCTHYPFLTDTIKKVAESLVPDRNINIIDPAPAVAKHTFDIMSAEKIIKREGFELTLHASGETAILMEMAAVI